MPTSPYAKAGLLALVLLISFIISWEVFLRQQGYLLSYDDNEDLWAYHHQKVYQATTANPVIIGSSRIKFGMDLATWQSATGAAPTQLALAGTSPRPLLADLARDQQFKGTVLVGITEGLFFAPTGSFPEQQARRVTAYYPNWSIAQRSGFALNRLLESRLIFLDEEQFNLSAMLKRLPIRNRPDVFALPAFAPRFTVNSFDRQTFLTPDFLADTTLQNRQRAIWMYIFTKAPRMPMSESELSGIFKAVAEDVASIQQRGGKVIFIRMPSTGPVWELEKQVFPREKYWDRLLQETGAPGIHFADYPELSKYHCPEWSHLKPTDAKTFTQDLIRIMEQKTGWAISRANFLPNQSINSSLTVR